MLKENKMNIKKITNALVISGLTLISSALFAQENNPANDALENIIIVGYPTDEEIAEELHELLDSAEPIMYTLKPVA